MIANPATAAAAIGRGLRLFHDALPVDECSFDWSVDRRLARADERIADGEGPGELVPRAPLPRTREGPGAHRRATRGRPSCRLSTGTPCVPNTLLHDDGMFAAHVDLGSLGVADRWADLAVAALEHGVGLRPRLRRRPVRRVRDRPRPGAHRLLPSALGHGVTECTAGMSDLLGMNSM